MSSHNPWIRALLALAPVILALAVTTLFFVMVGANPWRAYGEILSGAFESPRKWADILVAAVPLILAASGVLITSAAGLWNIGVEGQIVAGAIFATWAIKSVAAPAEIILPLSALAGILGGMVWGLLAGLLRTYGKVNEIFGGLGLNFIVAALTNYLIFGPWKPPDGATMSGTDPFPRAAWMPLLGTSRASLVTTICAILAIAGVYVLLRGTYWGLRLKSIGMNERAARRMGVPTARNMLLAFALCGALAGLAGSFQATAVYRRLIPQISGGYGYLALLVVLLSGLRAEWVPLVVFFFASLQVGSPRLELRMQLDSSIGGVMQATVVLLFVLMRGLRQRLEKAKE